MRINMAHDCLREHCESCCNVGFDTLWQGGSYVVSVCPASLSSTPSPRPPPSCDATLRFLIREFPLPSHAQMGKNVHLFMRAILIKQAA